MLTQRSILYQAILERQSRLPFTKVLPTSTHLQTLGGDDDDDNYLDLDDTEGVLQPIRFTASMDQPIKVLERRRLHRDNDMAEQNSFDNIRGDLV